MAFQKAVPTSFSGAKNFVKGSGRTATWVAMAVLGLGLYALASPYAKRIPVLGPLLGRGEQMVPGQTSAARVDQWGRRAG